MQEKNHTKKAAKLNLSYSKWENSPSAHNIETVLLSLLCCTNRFNATVWLA